MSSSYIKSNQIKFINAKGPVGHCKHQDGITVVKPTKKTKHIISAKMQIRIGLQNQTY